MRSSSRCVGCLLVLLAAGCSSYQPPQVRLGEATLTEVTDEAMRIDIDVELENPNPEPLELRSMTYTMSIDGRPVYTGRRSAQATLARSAVKTISIPGVIPYDLAPWDGEPPPAGAEWSVRGEIVYVTPDELAEILLDARLIEPKAAFSGGGVVRLDGAR